MCQDPHRGAGGGLPVRGLRHRVRVPRGTGLRPVGAGLELAVPRDEDRVGVSYRMVNRSGNTVAATTLAAISDPVSFTMATNAAPVSRL